MRGAARSRAVTTQSLAGLPIAVPATHAGDSHVYHLYVVRCDERDRLKTHLAADGISSAVHYPVPVHRQNGYAEKIVVPNDGLPLTERLAGTILSLPMYPELSDAEIDRVAASIRGYYAR